MKKNLVLLLVCYSIYAGDHDLILQGTWDEERYIETNVELPYSTFTINLQVNKNNQVIGHYCFVTRWGKKIDCFDDGTNNIQGFLKNKKIEVSFFSVWGGEHGRANITFDEKCNLNWKLVRNPDGEFYIPKKALLLPKIKIDSCNNLINLQNK